MKISLKWLKDYVEVPSDLKAFCDRLDLTGTGVEGIEHTGDNFKNIVTGQVIEKQAHPDSDHLWVTKVDVGNANTDDAGNPQPLQIVCGAQNFNQGDHIVVALVGAELPGDIHIKKSKLRGVESCGMNCSERELGLGNNHDGIMILPEDAPLGMPFAEYLGQSDTIIDVEITPNRPDCMSMVGCAREVSAMYGIDFTDPLPEMKAALAEDTTAHVADLADVTIQDTERCKRYTARVIKNVKIGPSPAWLAERVTAAGSRSINNVVDVTNYIMYLFGQPLHAFDYEKLVAVSGGDKAHIVVRPAADGEKFTTLDEEERVLNADMTVIATPQTAVALAGVMGGLDTEVTDESTTILLEAATFDRSHTSRTSRNLSLFSESSMRYERGVDDNPIADISAAAAALIAEVSGGTVAEGIVDEWPVHTDPIKLLFRIDRFNDMIGVDLEGDLIKDILQHLGCEVTKGAEARTFDVIAPTYRPDLEREIDLYEEVLRIYGMDRIEPTLPGGRGRLGVRTVDQRRMDIVHASLRASGMNETMTYSFADPHELEDLRMDPAAMGLGEAVELLNPMSADQSVMRQSIIPGLLRSVAYNQSRGVKNVQLYEVGVIFQAAEGRKKPKEVQKLAGVLAGAMGDVSWNVAPAAFDFFDGKGVLENLFRELAIPKVRFKAIDADEAAFLQPGRGAKVFSGGSELGWLGEIHPLAVDAYDATAPVVAFELDVKALLSCARAARDYVDVPTFPAVAMDMAIVVDEDVTNERLIQAIQSAGRPLLESVALFDVYRDDKRLGAGKKSMAYALTYRASDRTLTSDEVDKAHSRVVTKVCNATKGEIRG